MDLSQICIANLMQLTNSQELEMDMLRHMILNTIRFNNLKFRAHYGQLVLAVDSKKKKSWRKDVFPYYKATRERDRKSSPIDWASFYEMMGKLHGELATSFSYPIVNVPGAEGDDVIGVLAPYVAQVKNEPVLILSGDKDFVQLQSNPNIAQFSPVTKVDIFHSNPQFFLFEHIVRGDRVDGIPNIRSDDDTFVVEGKKQKKVFTKEVEEWFFNNNAQVPPDLQDKYDRNKLLIDLSGTPRELAMEIVSSYKDQQQKPSRMINYFIDHGLQKLMHSINDFERV